MWLGEIALDETPVFQELLNIKGSTWVRLQKEEKAHPNMSIPSACSLTIPGVGGWQQEVPVPFDQL